MELGSIFFHSTPVRPGAGGLGVTFKDDMDLRNCKITDLLIQDLKSKDLKSKDLKIQDLKSKRKKRQQVDKRWTQCQAKTRKPPKQNLEEVKEPNEQTLEDGVKGGCAGDVPASGDDVSVQTDATVEFFDDIKHKEDSPKDFGGVGGNTRKETDNSENENKKEEDDEDIEGKEKHVGEKSECEALEEIEQTQAGHNERHTDEDEDHSKSLVQMDILEQEQDIDDDGEKEEKSDPYDFDDSVDDPAYVPPKRRAPLPSSATKRPRLSCATKQPASSGGTPLKVVKTRTEHVEKRPKIDPQVLEFLVHRLAKAKGKNLAREVLPLSFFNELVRSYGALPGGAGLAPYTSGTDIITMTSWDVCMQ